MPSIYNEMPVKSKVDNIENDDLISTNDNGGLDNISMNNNGSNNIIDFSSPVSIDNTK